MAVPTHQTVFTRDIFSNYVCNPLVEAQAGGPFDVIIIGRGTLSLALARDFFSYHPANPSALSIQRILNDPLACCASL